MKVLVTGGLGFIGSAVVRHLVAGGEHHVVNVDKHAYSATTGSVAAVSTSPRYELIRADVADADRMVELFDAVRPDGVMHLAAESHVDRSIDSPDAFIRTNLMGTYSLLEAARRYTAGTPAKEQNAFRFLHVSTDEVFGTLGADGPGFTEASPYAPRSPYAASKAGSDHLVRAWGTTFGLPVLVSNCSNAYGPFQFPEKLVPLMIIRALGGEPLPVYGDGKNIRDWVFVEDLARALVTVLAKGTPGESYNLGGGDPQSNIHVVEEICDLVDELTGGEDRRSRSFIELVADRPGHDFRYEVNYAKARDELGWRPLVPFVPGVRETVAWYLANRE